MYSDDPHKNPDAERYDSLSYHDVIAQDLQVMDTSAIALSRENEIPILVFSLQSSGEFAKVVKGRGQFTVIRKEG